MIKAVHQFIDFWARIKRKIKTVLSDTPCVLPPAALTQNAIEINEKITEIRKTEEIGGLIILEITFETSENKENKKSAGKLSGSTSIMEFPPSTRLH